MRMLSHEGLTFDDVLLAPAYSNILPKETDLKTWVTRDIALQIPLLSAAMDTVTESRLAITLAQEGGLGIIHKNMSVADQAAQVRAVKKFESGVVKDPITVTPQTTVKELIELTRKHNISGVPVVEGEQLVGIVTNRDFRFETRLDEPVLQIMTRRDHLVTVPEGTEKDVVLQKLHAHRIEKVLVVNDQFQLRGLITVKDIQKAKEKPFSSKDSYGHLRVGAAVGVGGDTDERVEALVAAGVDVLIVDTAHGHSQGVISRVKWIKTHYPQVQVIGGNIATGEAAKALAKAGADAVKVGIGPGSICTTRVIAGVGVPQISAINNVYQELKGSHVRIIADGGIRHSGDIVKAIAAGADCVMIGGLLAGTEEAPGEVELYQGRSYKNYRGMGSLGAMAQAHGSSDRYFQDEQDGVEKLVPEGIEGRVAYKGSMITIVQQLMGGLRSGMGYTGCKTIDDMHNKPEFIKITSAGYRESHVHDVTITKEAPNYRSEQ
jgi:IMP dehydrogenase